MLDHYLGGHYKIIRAIDAGGFANTYIAEDYSFPDHRKCIVKCLQPASNDSDSLKIARRLFSREAIILKKLGEHDQIPRLLAYFEENNEFYLVQELIEGHPLSDELRTDRCWSEHEVVQMLQYVLPTLEFIHSRGVIHQDIKPSNLIRQEKDRRLVLIDFGAVKRISVPGLLTHRSLASTVCIGTLGYMPIEQARGKPRFSSDIYALGMIGIQALTGVKPIDLHEDADGKIIWQDRAKVSRKLADILSKMVRYRFHDRYQSAIEVLRDLDLDPPVSKALIVNQQDSEVLPKYKQEQTEISQSANPLASIRRFLPSLLNSDDNSDETKIELVFSQIDLAQTRINKEQKEIQSLSEETDILLNQLDYKVS